MKRTSLLLIIYKLCLCNNCIIVSFSELPQLIHAPTLEDAKLTATDISIRWEQWNKGRGDKGDPPIMWYTVMYQLADQPDTQKLAVVVLEMNCHVLQKCNATIRDLLPNTEYEIKISTRRYEEGGDGLPGPSLRVKTKCAGMQPYV